TLRPDSLVIATVTTALYCWWMSEHAERRRRAWLVAMYASLGVGTLAKGLVTPILVALVVVATTARTVGLAGLWRPLGVPGLAVFVALVAPWHVAARVANPGFLRDYLLNQHVANAFDRKVPRESSGDTLLFYLQAFLGRSAPWVLFLPLTLRETVDRLRGRGPAVAEGTILLWTWVLAVVGVFCVTPSRLEHYSLPALPAVALLAARAWDRLRMRGLSRPARVYFALVGVVL